MSSTEVISENTPAPAALAISDTGKARTNNEDRYALPPDLVPAAMRLARGHLYLVADGMGGHSAGEVAAELAARVIPERFYNDSADAGAGGTPFDVGGALRQAIAEAAEGIRFEQMLTRERAQMGTTVVAAVLRNDRMWVANVGDSRCYRMRDGNLEVLSQDHAWVAEQMRAGILTEEQAREHPQRSALTRALGHPVSAEPDLAEFDLRPGDRFLLCSDGLWECVGDEQIARAMRQNEMGDAARMLIAAALEAGGPDNVTVLIIGDGAAIPPGGTTSEFAKIVAVPSTVQLPPVAAVAGTSAVAQGIPAMAAAAPPLVEVVTPRPGLLSRLALPVAGLVGVCLCLGLLAVVGVFLMRGAPLTNPPPPTRATAATATLPAPPAVAITPVATKPVVAPAPTVAAAPATVQSASAPTAVALGPSLAPSSTPSAGNVITPGSTLFFPQASNNVTGTGVLTAGAAASPTVGGPAGLTRTFGLAGATPVTGTAALTPTVPPTSTSVVTGTSGASAPPPGSTLLFPTISVSGGGVFAGLAACVTPVSGACAAPETQFARGTRRIYLTWKNPLPIGTQFRAEWLLNGKIRPEAGDTCAVTESGCNPYVTRTSAMLSYVPPIPAGSWTYRVYSGTQMLVQDTIIVR